MDPDPNTKQQNPITKKGIAEIAANKLNSDRLLISDGIGSLSLVKVIHATRQQVSGVLYCLRMLFKLQITNKEQDSSSSPHFFVFIHLADLRRNAHSGGIYETTQHAIYFVKIYRNLKHVIDINYGEIANFSGVEGGRWRFLNGTFMPRIGFQCCPYWGELEAEQWILATLEAGFRLFDLTFFGHNRGHISKAIKKFLPWFNLSRTDVFISVKINIVRPANVNRLFCSTHGRDAIDFKDKFHSVSDYAHFCVDQSVEQFEGYIDLCMVHYPRDFFGEVSNICSGNRDDRAAVYGVLEHYLDVGTIRSIGTANFESDHVEHLVKDGHLLPALVQCEMHPFMQRADLVDYCNSKGIFLQAHSIFAYKEQKPSPAAQLQRHSLLKRVASLYQINTSVCDQ
ncbi:hypothetical protein niasHT_039344 [Heterodera trifolii]|uniref:NADP-dependent oxidoreductase domain-containing protein n=1 Tax=Heterodera trifolii TaxID=157864 RepID=A0ABD2IEG3_9BILA